MKENEILSEIHLVREEFARECGNDLNEIFRRMRARAEQLRAEGLPVVAPQPWEPAKATVRREKPPQPK